MLTRENQMLRHRIRDLGESGSATSVNSDMQAGSLLTCSFIKNDNLQI